MRQEFVYIIEFDIDFIQEREEQHKPFWFPHWSLSEVCGSEEAVYSKMRWTDHRKGERDAVIEMLKGLDPCADESYQWTKEEIWYNGKRVVRHYRVRPVAVDWSEW